MKFIIATHNAHKREELERILLPLGIEAVTDIDIGVSLPEVEETGATFSENAYLKAASACEATGLPAIADDSGLMVDALDGAPGVYSSRFAGEEGTPEECMDKLLVCLKDVPWEKRTARFVSSICCLFPDGKTVLAEGECPGFIAFDRSGREGFGYDPLFVVPEGMPGGGKSFGVLTPEEKDRISHRGNALRLFKTRLAAELANRKDD